MGNQEYIVIINRFGRATTRFDAINSGKAFPDSPVFSQEPLPQNLHNELGGFFHLFNGAATQELVSLIKAMDESPEALGLQFDSAEPDRFSDSIHNIYSCNGGGTVSFEGDWAGVSTLDSSRSMNATECRFGEHTLHGRVFQRRGVSNSGNFGPRINIIFLNYKNSTNNSDLTLITADVPYEYETEENQGIIARRISYSDDNYNYYHNNYDNERFLARTSMQITGGNITGTAEALDGIFGMSSRMRTNIPFSDSTVRGKPEVGKLALYSRHIGNRTIAIDAATGNPDTFYFHVTDENIMTSYILNWSEIYKIDSIDP